jgi:chromosome segregation ATPase
MAKIDIEEIRTKIRNAKENKIKLQERVKTLEEERDRALKDAGFKNVEDLKRKIEEVTEEVDSKEKELEKLLESAEEVLNG